MTRVYLVGSGIASLSAAVFMIRDAKVPGKDITIFDYEGFCGGSLDATGDPAQGYVCRGTRGFDYKAYVCMQDLLATIPSLADPSVSVNDMIHRFTDSYTIHSKTRLMRDGKSVAADHYGIAKPDLLALTGLVLKQENEIAHRPVSDFFSAAFFNSPFWWMFSTIFAFAPWHSAGEMRRYLLAFFQNVPDLHTLSSIRACPVNNYESIVLPLVRFLTDHGVQFQMQTEITDVHFGPEPDTVQVTALVCRLPDGGERVITVTAEDRVLITLGSIAAPLDSGSWRLWHTIAKGRRDFGNPALFTSQPDKTTMTTCTITTNDLEIYDLLESRFANVPDTNRLVTFTDSPWSLSLIVPKQPWFTHQPPDTRVLWCYGIWPDGIGKFVPKTMAAASPAEIMTELFSLLNLPDVPRLVAKAIGRKTVLPTGHAQFVCRQPGDRPLVIPPGSINLGLLGQYVECEGTTYTMEYSIRTAQKAVTKLFGGTKKVPPIYHGILHPGHQWRAAIALLK